MHLYKTNANIIKAEIARDVSLYKFRIAWGDLTCTIPFMIHIFTVSVLWCLLDFSLLCLLCGSMVGEFEPLLLFCVGGANLYCCPVGVVELKSVF